VSTEEHHVALPKLYGAPAYARPPMALEAAERPPNIDDLPLEAFRTEEDLQVAWTIVGSSNGGQAAVAVADGHGRSDGHGPRLDPRPFSLRSLSRFLSGRS